LAHAARLALQRERGAAARGQYRRKTRGQAAQALRLPIQGLACLAWYEQGGGRGLWGEALRHNGVAAVARLLSLLPAGLRHQDPRRGGLGAQLDRATQYSVDRFFEI